MTIDDTAEYSGRRIVYQAVGIAAHPGPEPGMWLEDSAGVFFSRYTVHGTRRTTGVVRLLLHAGSNMKDSGSCSSSWSF